MENPWGKSMGKPRKIHGKNPMANQWNIPFLNANQWNIDIDILERWGVNIPWSIWE